MGKGSGSPLAGAAGQQAATNSNALTANANGIYGTLAPELQSEIANPQGYSPATIANMTTAAEQTAGGATAGASGRGALLAGRTRNAGTAAKAISDAARTGDESLSQTNLGVQNENANLKAKQQQEGLGGMEGLYGTDVSGANTALGEVAPLVSANTGQINAGTAAGQDMFNDVLKSLQFLGEAAG